MNIKGKTKDTTNVRLDLEELGIMPKLHPIRKGNKIELPPAPHSLSKSQKEILCRFLKDLRVPDGFSSNISRCVNVKDCKISGLKSRDCHVLLQSILPLSIRGLLVNDVVEPLIELCQFLSVLCAKSVQVEHLKQIQDQIPLTLSKLETWMPPSCFDIMLHLSVHLADEVMLGGPVHFRWMYPGERYLHKLKLYVRNKARTEGSIAEGYIADECMTLCSRYLADVETKFNRKERNHEDDDNGEKKLSIFSHPGRPLGASKCTGFDACDREQAHLYVLKNCTEVDHFFEEYVRSLVADGVQHVPNEVDANFMQWFKKRVDKLHQDNNCSDGDKLLSLSRGPIQYVKSFSGYVSNGFRFHTIQRDKNSRTQNSGVVAVGDTGDGNGALDYYGVLKEVIRLEYLGGNYVVLFRCDWYDVWDSRRGKNVDKYGYVSVDTQRFLKTNEPFVLASQVSQVFYANDIVMKGSWRVVVKTKPHAIYEVPRGNGIESFDMKTTNIVEDAYQEHESFGLHLVESTYTYNEMSVEDRFDVEPEIVDASTLVKKRKRD